MSCSEFGVSQHLPVMVNEVKAQLAPKAGGRYVDSTLGYGGHAEALLTIVPSMHLLGIDRDAHAAASARERLARFGDRVSIVVERFGNIGAVVAAAGWKRVDGVLADLGVSSPQLDEAHRGFSFKGGPLDMRMANDVGTTAAEWLASADEEEIADVLWQYGEERKSRFIARRICQRRKEKPFERTEDLAAVIAGCVGHRGFGGKHPATRSFQAIRIYLNDELGELRRLLQGVPSLLAPGGRFVVISYHSLEDRLVKHCFRHLAGHGFSLPHRRSMAASEQEVEQNPRARSAKLRTLERISEAACPA